MAIETLDGVFTIDGVVRPEWIDINGHMNVAYYLVGFDGAIDALWTEFGINDDYIRSKRGSTFAVECHVTYQRELNEGEAYCITSQILAYDEKRIHQFQRMYHAQKKYLAATAEWMNLHVSLETRRVTPWPDDVLESIASWSAQQPKSAYPDEAGKRMSVKKPLFELAGGTKP